MQRLTSVACHFSKIDDSYQNVGGEEEEKEEEGGGGEAVSRTVETKTVRAAAAGHCWFLTEGDGTKMQQ